MSQLIYAGVAGLVADGGMRDVQQIRKLGLPVYCSGPAAPPSPAGLMPADLQRLIGCGLVAVFPGDFIVADEDGVVVVPKHLAEEVASAGAKKERQDMWVQKQVAAGSGVRGVYPPMKRPWHAFIKKCRKANDNATRHVCREGFIWRQ